MRLVAILFLALAVSGAAMAQDTRLYTEGPVMRMSYIRVKPGMLDEYMKFLDGVFKTQMEAVKKAGLILRYSVLRTEPRSPQEPNLILTITYPNMAALDRNAEFREISLKALSGTSDAENKGMAERGAIREVLGSELVRELILK
jgi:hypothetical protein